MLSTSHPQSSHNHLISAHYLPSQVLFSRRGYPSPRPLNPACRDELGRRHIESRHRGDRLHTYRPRLGVTRLSLIGNQWITETYPKYPRSKRRSLAPPRPTFLLVIDRK